MTDKTKQRADYANLASSANVVAKILAFAGDKSRQMPGWGPELDALLAFLVEEHAEGREVCSTDIVRLRRFGTLPTVTKKLQQLEGVGFIERPRTSDRRVKSIIPTAGAHAHFDALAQALCEALSS